MYTLRELLGGLYIFLFVLVIGLLIFFVERNEIYIPSKLSVYIASLCLFVVFLPSAFLEVGGAKNNLKVLFLVLIICFAFIFLPGEFRFSFPRILFSSSLDMLPNKTETLSAKFVKYHPSRGKDCPKLQLLINGNIKYTCDSGLDYQERYFFSNTDKQWDIEIVGKKNILGFYGEKVVFQKK